MHHWRADVGKKTSSIYFINVWRFTLSSINLSHSTTCFSFAECSLQGMKEKAPHGGLKFNLRMVEATGFVIIMTQIKSRLLYRTPLPSLASGRLGREGSHLQIPPPCADTLASWQGLCNNWLGTAASQLRGKTVKRLLLPSYRPSCCQQCREHCYRLTECTHCSQNTGMQTISLSAI